MVTKKQLSDIANVLRRDVAIMTTNSGSGHLTSCFSCAEILSCLFFHEMVWDIKDSKNPDNDEFILSKGHASPILYSALYRSGAIKHNLNNLRKLNSPLEGHPMPKSLSQIKVATGSLGQGLSVGIGMAFASKLQGRKFRIFVLMGDSETSEGSVWEAFQLASHYKLNNLCAIIDANRLGQRGQTMLGHDVKTYKKRIQSFGWNTLVVDGHNINQLIKALLNSKKSQKPTCIIAKTFKGKGVSFLENKENWHGRVMDNRHLHQALDELPHVSMPKIKIKKPIKMNEIKIKYLSSKPLNYSFGKEIATREAYGETLANLAILNNKIIAIDAEVSNSTRSEEVKKRTPRQFIETFIAEQNLIGIALGLSVKGFKPFASTFATFLTRAHDQIRMASLSSADFTICGSHAGVSIGEDGASQMGLEDISMFRSLPNSTIFYPSDAVSTKELTKLASKNKGITYIRTTRPKTQVIYANNEKFPIGDFKILKESKKDKGVIIGAGITLHESLEAHKNLMKKNFNVAVVDLYCIKPFNSKKLIDFIKKHGNKIVISEDHYQEGGIGEMLAEELENTNIKIKHLYVSEIPHSGTKEELLKKYKIDSSAIVKGVEGI
ncbi:transketolase [Candidatus Pacearchaeota archaeon CG10_big_fil_rev_8_21_14_0_10_30_48]|nr:MAG: transketolase [Candidatus Pacearchaeota archaeon CG10_big_fil_rev_8_21_14_0_10_30_48]